MDGAPDIGYWLGRKYAILQQQANTGDFQANTGRIGTLAAARVDNTRADLMPAESFANIDKAKADAQLTRTQNQYYGAESNSRVKLANAQAFSTTQDGLATKAFSVDTVGTSPQSIANIRGMRPGMPTMGGVYGQPSTPGGGIGGMTSMGEVSAARPRRYPGESAADYMDRTGWGSN